jgi:hypothetical protein
MSLIEKNKYLFDIGNEEDFRYIFREFLKTDDLRGNQFLNIIYDYNDYKEYR